jgi:hypothetical protein
MKLIYCTCNVSVLEPLLGVIQEIGLENYQVVEQVTAKNRIGDDRLNTPVWPGYNSSVVMQITDDNVAESVMARIRQFNKNAFNTSELVIACMLNMDDYCFD